MNDFKFALRQLFKNPGFTSVAVLALALGVGANTAIFSVVNGVLLRPLNYREPDRLVRLNESNVKLGFPTFSVAPCTFLDWQIQSRVFEGLAAISGSDFNLTGVEKPERVSGLRVSANLFSVLKVHPELGRLLLPEEDAIGRNDVVLLSRSFWQKRFGGDKQILGKRIILNGQSRTVVGVLEAPPTLDASLWVPMSFNNDERGNRGGHYLGVLGRLKPGVSLEQARADMASIASNLERQYPDSNKGWSVLVQPLLETVVGDTRPALVVLVWVVGLVLLIACANVANLLLAKAASRQKEFAIRAALGAGRWRLIRQLLTESLLLGLGGGAVGFILAMLGLALFRRMAPENLPRVSDVRLDSQVLGFTLLVSLATGLIFGFFPALQATRLNLNEPLKEGGRGLTESRRRNRLRNGLVISEIALSLVLLVDAGLLIRSFVRLNREPPGYQTSQLLAVDLGLPEAKYKDVRAQAAFLDDLLDRLTQLPGIESVGAVSALPLSGANAWYAVRVDGRPPPALGEPASAAYREISAGYLHAMKIPMISGREFSDLDRESAPGTVVVNQTFARSFFPKQEALGRRIQVSEGPGPNPCEIVGVIKDVKNFGLEEKMVPEMYFPYRQRSSGYFSVVVRTTTEPASMANVLRDTVLAIDSDQPIHNIRTMDQLVVNSMAGRRFMTTLLGIFAGVALILCAIGIYGLISYTVAQRTHEFGIRMALGARVIDVLQLVLRQGVRLALAGLILGVFGAWVGTRLLANQLYGIEPHDPITFSLGILALGTVALLAYIIPASRAARVDPMEALRCE
jgi:putative ABC transport system permease protein